MHPLISDLQECLESLLARGGPTPFDYDELNQRVATVAEAVGAGEVARAELSSLKAPFGPDFQKETLQGHALYKPMGYSGDFLIIDKIYLRCRTPLEPLAAWDDYFHTHAATQAVRNRKRYFHEILRQRVGGGGTLPRVLNIGSGPGRCVREFLNEPWDAVPCGFTLVDLDPRALSYARRLLAPWEGSIEFVHANALRFESSSTYDLVWSAGLFDYLDDPTFARLLGRMWRWTAPGGRLVVGNFSPANPSRGHMEVLLDWYLIHRSPDDLLRLAADAGLPRDAVTIDSEELGVNLFLRAEKGG